MFIETRDGPEGALLRFSLRNCYNEYSLLLTSGLSFESARVLNQTGGFLPFFSPFYSLMRSEHGEMIVAHFLCGPGSSDLDF